MEYPGDPAVWAKTPKEKNSETKAKVIPTQFFTLSIYTREAGSVKFLVI
jgi:hypothetical protein